MPALSSSAQEKEEGRRNVIIKTKEEDNQGTFEIEKNNETTKMKVLRKMKTYLSRKSNRQR
jgi:hypothetical protein